MRQDLLEQQEDGAVFIGHSTVLIRLNEKNLLTDPLYLRRLYILKRHLPPGIPLQALPPLDAILISHGHLDHMDLATLSAFPRDLPVILPEKLEGYLRNLGFRDVRSLSWGEGTQVGSLRILALPCQHTPGRSLYETRSIPQSYLIQGTKTFFFAGDSGLTPAFEETGRTFGIDLAFLPIGSYRPESFRRYHLSPEDALEAMEMLRARRMVPIHWGAFRLSWEPVEEPGHRLQDLLQKRGMNPRVVLLPPGRGIRV